MAVTKRALSAVTNQLDIYLHLFEMYHSGGKHEVRTALFSHQCKGRKLLCTIVSFETIVCLTLTRQEAEELFKIIRKKHGSNEIVWVKYAEHSLSQDPDHGLTKVLDDAMKFVPKSNRAWKFVDSSLPSINFS